MMLNLFLKAVFVTFCTIIFSQYVAAQNSLPQKSSCGPSAAEQKRAGDARAARLETEIEEDAKALRWESVKQKKAEYEELMTKDYKEPDCGQKKDTRPGGLR